MKILRFTLTALIIFCLSFSSYSQKEANHWYFGEYAGLDFSGGLAVAVTDGALTTGEGCSSISNSAGDLMFYTDGSFVWNKDHQQMPNGWGLLGNYSSSQSGIIVPKPSSTTQYYIFTVDAVDNSLVNGLNYTLVDMTLDGGNGDVVTSEKNINLIAPTCEKVTAVGNNSGSAFWVVTHHWGSNAFYSYSVTSAGVNPNPVISYVGHVLSGSMEDAKGYIKTSPNGDWIVMANNTAFNVEIFQFNNSTGVVSNPIHDDRFAGTTGGPYGVEFSPNSRLLYISQWKGGRVIWQYDLEAGSGSADDILNSRIQVATVGQNDDPVGALQIGPDNRLYVARRNNSYLSVFTSPNTYGLMANFVSQGVHLAGRESSYGLPPFIQSFFSMNAEFYNDPPCWPLPVQFYGTVSDTPDSVYWDFGDPASGASNISKVLNPSHNFTNSGLYLVTFTAYIQGQSAHAFHFVIVNSIPQAEAGPNQNIPFLSTTQLDGSGIGGTEPYNYAWAPANLLDDTTIANPNTVIMEYSTWFYLTITNENGYCESIDSVYVEVTGSPLGVDPQANPSALCLGEQSNLTANAGGGSETYTYTWTSDPPGFNSNFENPTVIPNETTTYIVEVYDGYNTASNQVTVTVHEPPTNEAGDDQYIVYNANATLTGQGFGGSGDYSYFWEPADKLIYNQGAVVTTVQLIESQVFTLHVIDNVTGCESEIDDYVSVFVEGGPLTVSAYADQSIVCEGGEVQIQAVGGGGDPSKYSYSWSASPPVPGLIEDEPVQTVVIYEYTLFTVEITDTYSVNSTTIGVGVSMAPNVDLGNGGEIQACPYDTIIIESNVSGSAYYWSNGSTQSKIYVGSSGAGFDVHEYTLQVWDQYDCMGEGDVMVIFNTLNCTGIEEFGENQSILIQPNPNNGKFTFSAEGVRGTIGLEIFSVQGQQVYEGQFEVATDGKFEQNIDFSFLPRGIYFMKLFKGNQVFAGKFMIE